MLGFAGAPKLLKSLQAHTAAPEALADDIADFRGYAETAIEALHRGSTLDQRFANTYRIILAQIRRDLNNFDK